MIKNEHIDSNEGDQPPFFDSWPKLYILVLIVHFILIGLFYWFTKFYA